MKKPKQLWHLYIIKCGDGSLYTGITTDIERRLKEHKGWRGRKIYSWPWPIEIGT